MVNKIEIRHATMADLEQISEVEKRCFPPLEAASKESFRERLTCYPDHFWLLFLQGQLISFVDGFVCDETILTDEMFACASMHNPSGHWQMIFGVNTLPEYRRCGYASMLINTCIEQARKENRKGVILTCKKEKIQFYSSFGFVNEGLSESNHGGEVWYQMVIRF